MNKVVITLIMMCVLCAAETVAQGSRIMLTQLERGQVQPADDSLRSGQIGLTNTNGDQRYAPYVEIQVDSVNFIPTPTGNTTNLSEFVYDTTGTLWYIDWQGRAVEFAAGSSSCDVDWLQISDNSCPDAITDSIYKQRYASVGARLVWPGAEFLVNDSTTSGILVVQGSRNARTAWWDSNSGTFSMFDHGGSTPAFYMPVGANMVFKTTAGTPQTPVGSQVDHFAINTQDSTIQMFRYPRTRADTQSVVNFLYTDPVGKVRSRPVTYISDSVGVNIYNASGLIGKEVERVVTLDTLAVLEFNYEPAEGGGDVSALTIASGEGGGVGGYVEIRSNDGSDQMLVENDNVYLMSDGSTRVGDLNAAAGGYGVFVEASANTLRVGDPFDANISGLFIDFAVNTTTISESVENFLTVSSDGTGITGGWAGGSQFYVANASETDFILQNNIETQIYNYNGDDYTGISIDTVGGRVFIDKSKSDMAYKLGFDSDNGNGIVVFLSDTLPLEGQTLIAGSDQTFYFGAPAAGANIYNSDGETPDNVTRTVTVGGNGASEAGFLKFDYSNNVYSAVEIFGGDGAGGSGSVSLNAPNSNYLTLDNSGIHSELSPASEFSVDLNSGNSEITQTPGSVLITGSDTQGSTALYRIAGDTTGDMTLITRRNAGQQQAVVSLSTGATGIVQSVMSAYNADAPRTLNAVVVDTSGVGINTQGSVGDALQVLQSDGDKLYYGVKIEDGQLTADQLSFGANGWENVNANRYMYSIGYGSTPSITPSVGATEIIIGDTATTSTVNLNFIPGNLDGADYSGINTTVRYIYNFGSGNATLDTNESWLFRLAGVGAGSSTVTLGTMKQAKLVWVAGSSTANSRFWVFITDLQ